MNDLYHIEDNDRPMYVLAEGWNEAITKWKARIKEENGEDVYREPLGVTRLCGFEDLIL